MPASAAQIRADMTRQCDAWVALKRPRDRRGAWYGAREVGRTAGARSLTAAEAGSVRPPPAGFTLQNSRTGELSWHRGEFIYHAQLPA
jgi:hypothetical protein